MWHLDHESSGLASLPALYSCAGVPRPLLHPNHMDSSDGWCLEVGTSSRCGLGSSKQCDKHFPQFRNSVFLSPQITSSLFISYVSCWFLLSLWDTETF